ncbi:MAG: acetate--CoA ligase family protein [Ilumatobacteraceae bacterium]
MGSSLSLSESESKELLKTHGVPFGVESVVSTPEEARQWALDHRAPFVVKANGPQLAHKSERGLVQLGLASAEAVRDAAVVVLSRITPEDGLVTLTVAEMTVGSRELIVGASRDQSLGPCILIGHGGIFAEQLADVAVRQLPIDDTTLDDMLAGLRSRAVFDAARHCAPLDRDALRELADSLWSAMQVKEVESIDLNPVIVRDDGSLCAVDALVTKGSSQSSIRGSWGVAVDLAPLFNPRGVCIVGASTHPGKFGFVALHNLLASGYQGRVIAVGRGSDSYLDAETYADVSEIPEGVVDAAFICTPSEGNVAILEQLARKGVRAVFVATAGYREAGADGAGAEQELVDAAVRLGITLAGPNGQGLVSTPAGLCLQIVAPHPPKGPIGIASQSGNFVSTWMNMSRARNVGVSRALSVGNAPHVGVPEVLEYLAKDSETRVGLCYLEDLSRAQDFLSIARPMVAHKPVVVVKGGTTAQGAKAASSHTGSLAGDAAAFLGACRQYGLTACETMDEAFDAAAVMATLPVPRGPRVAVLTTVGGWGVAVADQIGKSTTLTLTNLSDAVMASLDEILPPRWSKGNPIDSAGGETRETVESIFEILLSSPEVDSVVFLGLGIQSNQARLMREGRFYPDHGIERIVGFHEGQDVKYAQKSVEASKRYGKPILVATELATADQKNPGVVALRDLGVPVFASAASVVRALEHATRWGTRHA